jgi:hypothetical protein
LAVWLLNSVTAKELVNKNFQLGQATTENYGLHERIAALLNQTRMTEAFVDYLGEKKELARKLLDQSNPTTEKE